MEPITGREYHPSEELRDAVKEFGRVTPVRRETRRDRIGKDEGLEVTINRYEIEYRGEKIDMMEKTVKDMGMMGLEIDGKIGPAAMAVITKSSQPIPTEEDQDIQMGVPRIEFNGNPNDVTDSQPPRRLFWVEWYEEWVYSKGYSHATELLTDITDIHHQHYGGSVNFRLEVDRCYL